MARKRTTKRFSGYHDPRKVMNAKNWGVRSLRLNGMIYRDGSGYKANVCVGGTAKIARKGRGSLKCGSGAGASPSKAVANALSHLAKYVRKNG